MVSKKMRPLERVSTDEIMDELGERFAVLAMTGWEGTPTGEVCRGTSVGDIPTVLGLMDIFASQLRDQYKSEIAGGVQISQRDIEER